MARLLFPDITQTPEQYEKAYPARAKAPEAMVTRFAPSPTGFLHIGSLFAAFVAKSAARATNGTFYLRIEDTDKKREVEDGISGITDGLKTFAISPDEGMIGNGQETGGYGPYIQSKRTGIYQAYAKSLVERGLAYPCFMTEDEISEIRQRQSDNKELPGIYGEYAKYRGITPEEAQKRIENGDEYVVRLLSPGKPDGKISFTDRIKGKIEMPENILDIVLLKKDGTPTYHFAHAVDDHLMRTTDVTRGDEWISSAPIHLQLFSVLGFKPPKYAHISPIMKEDPETGGKRKLSKRKDPEANVEYYARAGYPAGAVTEYLMTIANSNFEEWRKCTNTAPIAEFKFPLNKLSKAGALFDLAKLNDISKNYISLMDADSVYNAVRDWARANDTQFYEALTADESYSKAVFAIDRGGKKPRKDIAKWDEARGYAEYFYNDLWDGSRDLDSSLSSSDMIEILTEYKKIYNPQIPSEDWFPQLREMAERLGYAGSPKLYKQEPDKYKGHAGDVSNVIRAAVTGRKSSPDLYSIMRVLGFDEVMSRLDGAIELLK